MKLYHLVKRLELEHVAISLFNAGFVALLKAQQILVTPVDEKFLATVGFHSDLDHNLRAFTRSRVFQQF